MADKQISELTAASNLTDSTLLVVEQGGSAMKANWGMMKNYISPGVAQIYSSSSTYAVGDYVLYQDTLYRCTTAITTAEAWTAAHWTAAVLGDDVGDLKSAIQQDESVIYTTGGAYAVAASPTGYRLNESDGLCSSNAGYKLVKFACNAGTLVKIVSDDRWQFQSSASVPASGTSNRVGKTYGTGTFFMTVPNTATYIIISSPIDSSNAKVYSTSTIEDDVEKADILIDSEIDRNTIGYYELKQANFEQGNYTNTGVKEDASRVIRASQVYKIKDGDKLVTKASDTLYMGWYLLSAAGVLLESGFNWTTYRAKLTNKEHTFSHDGFLYITIANGANYGNSSNITPTDYTDGVVNVYNSYMMQYETNVTSIVSLNKDIPQKVLNGKKPFDRATTVPLALLHFSDIHGDGTNLSRLVTMANKLGADIDDVLCTGDMAYNNYSESCMDYWDAVDGAENILCVVGNHDLADGEHGYSSDQIGQETAYAKYFSPYVSNWGVTMAGVNLTYWYKDYAAKKVRLIGLNYLLTGDELTAQNTWLASRLTEAKTAGYAVVIAEHTPLNGWTGIDCNFNIIGKPWAYNEFPTSIQDTVKTYMDNGGEFACYLGGHSHCDYVGYNSSYPGQLFIGVTTALTTGYDNDQRRENNEKSKDAANVVLIDTVTKAIKLVRVGADMDTYLRGRHLFSIKYTDKTITAQS